MSLCGVGMSPDSQTTWKLFSEIEATLIIYFEFYVEVLHIELFLLGLTTSKYKNRLENQIKECWLYT